jgi:hypothetical protein
VIPVSLTELSPIMGIYVPPMRPYDVRLDGESCWIAPASSFTPPQIPTVG